MPKSVIDAITRTYTKHHANVHRGVHCLSQEATDEQEQTRREVASWIGAADPAEVIFTRGTTEGITLVASCLTQGMEAGDDYDSHTLKNIMHHSPSKDYMLEYEQCRKEYLVPLEEMVA